MATVKKVIIAAKKCNSANKKKDE